jgi:3-(3-hydroxy-phenyl)propionate hydroxylase
MSGNLDGLSDRYDAVVVGVGPVGALAANLIGREGLATLAVDQAPAPYNLPRAMGIDHESLRLFQSIGVTEAMAPHMGAYRATEYRAASGAVLRRIVQPQEPHPLSWPPYATFLQPQLEAAARAAMAECPWIAPRLGLRARLMAQDGEWVSLRLEDVGTGAARDIACRYLLACDGASSPVREDLGICLEDMRFDEPWLVVDMLVDDPSGLPEMNVQTCDPARPSTYICGPGNLRRWEVMLLPGEDPAEISAEASIWRLLAAWIRPGEGRIWRAATYRFHALVAERWRQGNVFLLGDAAHQTPPFMAQGLNQGLRDAGNLCWKLGEVFHGRAAASLLDSYELERRPATWHAIEMAKTLGHIICERDPAAAAERDCRMLAEMEAGLGVVVRQNLLPQELADGFLLRDAEGRPTPGAGRAFPQPWVLVGGQRQRMDDALRARWLLVCRPGWTPDADTLGQARTMGVTLAALGPAAPALRAIEEQDGLIAGWMAALGADAVLVRPDRAVFGCAGGAAPELALLQALQRALSAPLVA